MSDVLDRVRAALASRYAVERFLRENELTAALAHLRILMLIDSGQRRVLYPRT